MPRYGSAAVASSFTLCEASSSPAVRLPPPPPLRGMVSSLVFASTENSGCEKIEEDQIAVATTAYILHPAYTYLGSKANANE